MQEHWTIRYNSARTASEPITLRAPIARSWVREARDGQTLGGVCAGDGAVFTAVGLGFVKRLDLKSGEVVWTDPLARSVGRSPGWTDKNDTRAGLYLRWRDDLLVYGGQNRTRALNLRSGAELWSKTLGHGLGVRDSFITCDILVGPIATAFHAVEIESLRELWRVDDLAMNPLVGDERHVIQADTDVTCYDLRSGKVLWQRSRVELGGEVYRYGCIWRGRYYVIFGGQLTCLDLKDGNTVWRWPLPSFIHGWHPYDGRAYFLLDDGYVIVDLEAGREVFRRAIGPRVPEPPRLKKRGLTAGTRGEDVTTWRGALVVVSETHAFLTNNRSGQIVVLERETGELVQVAEFEGMSTIEPVIYDNHLLIADFNATVHCFSGAP